MKEGSLNPLGIEYLSAQEAMAATFAQGVRNHIVDLEILADDARLMEVHNIAIAKAGGGQVVSEEIQQNIIEKKIAAKVKIGVQHNEDEHKYDELYRSTTYSEALKESNRLQALNSVSVSPYVTQESRSKNRARIKELDKNMATEDKRRNLLHDSLNKSNNLLVGSQKSEPIHSPGLHTIRSRRRFNS